MTPQRRRSVAVGSLIGVVAAVVIAVLLSRTDDKGAVLSQPGAYPNQPIGSFVDVTGKKLPAGTFERLGGGTLRFSDFKGKALVVNVWASTCAPCIKEMPAFESVHQSRQDIAFVGLNYQDRMETAQRFATKTGVTYDLVLDHDGVFPVKMSVAGMPTTYFVGADGTVRHVERGAVSAGELSSLIDEKLLGT
ncbi:MAG TPA: TlpA disulfide reductase family protein [Acidimicrobiales bacterium]